MTAFGNFIGRLLITLIIIVVVVWVLSFFSKPIKEAADNGVNWIGEKIHVLGGAVSNAGSTDPAYMAEQSLRTEAEAKMKLRQASDEAIMADALRQAMQDRMKMRRKDWIGGEYLKIWVYSRKTKSLKKATIHVEEQGDSLPVQTVVAADLPFHTQAVRYVHYEVRATDDNGDTSQPETFIFTGGVRRVELWLP
jgi:hypothetical protein